MLNAAPKSQIRSKKVLVNLLLTCCCRANLPGRVVAEKVINKAEKVLKGKGTKKNVKVKKGKGTKSSNDAESAHCEGTDEDLSK